MNKGDNASSSRPHPDNSEAVAGTVKFLLSESNQVRGEVHCGKSLQTLVFYSRIINTAVEATKKFKTMIDKFTAMTPPSEAEHIANLFDKACDVNKEVIQMLSSDFQTNSSSTSSGGGHKKVLIWKKQCEKNIDRIELLIKEAYSREFYTWFDAFALHAMFHGFCGILAFLYNIQTFRSETSDDHKLKAFAEGILETFEEAYKKILSEEKENILKGILKSSQEREVNKKMQEEETMKELQEEENTGDVIFKFGSLTFKKKNGGMERVQED